VRFVGELEEVGGVPDALGGSEHEVAVRSKGIVKDPKHSSLRGRIEIDQEVAAAHDVEA
jgi:hypothetical protein